MILDKMPAAMTRYTNFARKRTYLDAELNYRDDGNTTADALHDNAPMAEPAEGDSSGSQPAKKRKRNRPEKRNEAANDTTVLSVQDAVSERSSGPREGEGEGDDGNEAGSSKAASEKRKTAAKGERQRRQKHQKDAQSRQEASERRRLKRKDERFSDTTCFACREKGHTARDCTRTVSGGGEGGDTQGEAGNAKAKASRGMDTVGICYRCGSRKHTLSRCRELADPSNPFPFASCFVCSGKGHLASACPQNQAKGVYPNGGCCKLCRETTHLAKDCSLRKQEVIASTVFLGTGRDAGADEDDFHTFKRRNAEVDKSEKTVERVRRQADVKMGAHTGIIKSFGKKTETAAAKKVVHF